MRAYQMALACWLAIVAEWLSVLQYWGNGRVYSVWIFGVFMWILVVFMLCFMMTSSNGNIFCVTDLLRGDPSVTGGFPWQRPVTRSLDVFCDLRPNKWLSKQSVTDGFPSQRPVTRNYAGFFDIRLNKRLSKQSRCRWFETPSRSLWRHCNVNFVSQRPVL